MSLLYHQTLGVLDQIGDVTPRELAGIVLELPPFRQVGKERYKRFLQHLMATDHLEFSAERTLLIAEQGDRVIHHYSGLATFEDTSDFAVTHQSDHIGRLAGAPPDNTPICLAGRTWRVILTDPVAKTVFVEPARGNAVTLCLADGLDTHARVTESMRDILAGHERFGYLMPRALATPAPRERLAELVPGDELARLGKDAC